MAVNIGELRKNLESYSVQLDTVETALIADPDSEELLTLQRDLQEVIHLTNDLIANACEDSNGHGNDGHGRKAKALQKWKAGDKCQAMFSEDGRYYEAVIDEIDDDGKVSVTFPEYGNTDITEVSLLKKYVDPQASVAATNAKIGETGPIVVSSDQNKDARKALSKKEKMLAEREYKRKKQQKKRDRMLKLEEEKEKEKNKWVQFNLKVSAKNKKGQVKHSIFASPESVSGRVGIGTCGTADRPMTSNPSHEKHRMYKPQM